MPTHKSSPKHVEITSTPQTPLGGNPVSQALNVVVSVPDKIDIRMVDASTLEDYEIWVFISSILSNAVVGFWIAHKQTQGDTAFLWSGIVFGILFLISIYMVFRKRSMLTKKSKLIALKASEAVQKEDEIPNS